MRIRRTISWMLALALTAAAIAFAQARKPPSERPVLSFGVLADIQYADKPSTLTGIRQGAGAREYRKSIEKLQSCLAAMQPQKLDFVIQVGDITDDGADDMAAVLTVLKGLRPPLKHVLGNHDFYAGRGEVLKRIGLPQPHYDFSLKNWRFVVLDGMEISVGKGWPESSANYQTGAHMLAALKEKRERNANDWNGAVGEAQREWLRRILRDAGAKGERAIVFCHFPVLAESCRPDHLLWDHREVLEILESSPSVVAWMNGHDHRGGYAARNRVHYITFPGMVESDTGRACNVVEVYRDRIELRYPGKAASRTLRIQP